jgi:hypothetical protein
MPRWGTVIYLDAQPPPARRQGGRLTSACRWRHTRDFIISCNHGILDYDYVARSRSGTGRPSSRPGYLVPKLQTDIAPFPNKEHSTSKDKIVDAVRNGVRQLRRMYFISKTVPRGSERLPPPRDIIKRHEIDPALCNERVEGSRLRNAPIIVHLLGFHTPKELH